MVIKINSTIKRETKHRHHIGAAFEFGANSRAPKEL